MTPEEKNQNKTSGIWHHIFIKSTQQNKGIQRNLYIFQYYDTHTKPRTFQVQKSQFEIS